MRWIVGSLFIVAALLKGVQFFVEPAAVLATPLANWLSPAQIGIELAIGLLVLSGLFWHRVRWLALFAFIAFAAYSFYQATAGAASCGCFGPVKVHPWWTFLLDVVIVAGLSASILRRNQPERASISSGVLRQRILAGAILAISLVGAALLMRFAQIRTVQAEGLLSSAGNLVILEPEKWIGKPLPIADAIDLDLTQGDWIVLLHRHDCPDCQAAVPKYKELARSEPVALVEVPPYGSQDDSTFGAALRGRLTNDREWFVQTPVELRLQNGVVLAVEFAHGH